MQSEQLSSTYSSKDMVLLCDKLCFCYMCVILLLVDAIALTPDETHSGNISIGLGILVQNRLNS